MEERVKTHKRRADRKREEEEDAKQMKELEACSKNI